MPSLRRGVALTSRLLQVTVGIQHRLLQVVIGGATTLAGVFFERSAQLGLGGVRCVAGLDSLASSPAGGLGEHVGAKEHCVRAVEHRGHALLPCQVDRRAGVVRREHGGANRFERVGGALGSGELGLGGVHELAQVRASLHETALRV